MANEKNLLTLDDLGLVDQPLAEQFFDKLSDPSNEIPQGAARALRISNDFFELKDLDLETGEGTNVYLDETEDGQTIEAALYNAGKFSNPENHSNTFKDNGFLTLYFLVRRNIELGDPFNIEDILENILGDELSTFKDTAITDPASTTLKVVIDISTPNQPQPYTMYMRVVTLSDFVAFVNKYPQVAATGALRDEYIEKLVDPGTILETVDASSLAPTDLTYWQPSDLPDDATHYVSFGNPFKGDQDFSHVLPAATVRNNFIQTSMGWPSPRALDIQVKDASGNYKPNAPKQQKFFNNAGAAIIANLSTGTPIIVLREGVGKGHIFAEILYSTDGGANWIGNNEPPTPMGYVHTDKSLYIDSRVLNRPHKYVEAMFALPSGLGKDNTNYKTELVKTEVPDPNSDFQERIWHEYDKCDPWLNEKTNQYCVTVEQQNSESDTEKIRKEGVLSLLRYYDKRRNPEFVDKLLALSDGLFANVLDWYSSARQDNTDKFLVAIPRTYFEAPELEHDYFTSEVSFYDEINKKENSNIWYIKTSELQAHVAKTKNIIQYHFSTRIEKSSAPLTPEVDIDKEVENIDKFIAVLKGFMELNDAQLRFDKADQVAILCNDNYEIQKVLYHQLDISDSTDATPSKSARKKTKPQPTRFLSIGVSCCNEETSAAWSPRTLAYLHAAPDMSLALKNDKNYAGLKLVTAFTKSPQVKVTPGGTKENGGVDKIDLKKPSAGKTTKSSKELDEENKQIENPEARLERYKNRVDVTMSPFDNALKNLENTFAEFQDADEWYGKLLNRINLRDIIRAGYTCVGKIVPMDDLAALALKNVLKTIGYDNLKELLKFFGQYANEMCPDLYAQASGTEGPPPLQAAFAPVISESDSQEEVFNLIIEKIIEDVEVNYLCYSEGEIKTAIYPNRQPGVIPGDGEDQLKEYVWIDDMLQEVGATAPTEVQLKEISDNEAKQREAHLQDLNSNLVSMMDYKGIFNCVLKIIIKKRNEIAEKLIEFLKTHGIDPSLAEQILYPEKFVNDFMGEVDWTDPAGTIHRIENYQPTFEIPELPRGHDDPLQAVDQQIEALYDIIGGAIAALVKTIIDEFLKLCDSLNIAKAIESLTDEKENSQNSLKNGLGELPETISDLSPWERNRWKLNNSFSMPPVTLSGLQFNRPGELSINDLMEAGFGEIEAFYNIIAKMGKLPTDILITESIDLIDNLSKILKPSEICSMMLGEANVVIYKIVYKNIRGYTISTSTDKNYNYPNLRTIFDSLSDVREFFVLLGRYVDLSFCSAIVADINSVIGACERNMQDDWYCAQLKKKGYSDEDCKELLAKNLNRDRERLEHLGDLLMAGEVTDLSSIPPVLQALGQQGMVSGMPPYLQNLLGSTSDSLLDLARSRFDLEVRGIKGIFVDEVFIEQGSQYRRPPELGRDFMTYQGDGPGSYGKKYPDEPVDDYGPASWPQGDVTVRKVAESLKLNLALDNSNILRHGPANVSPSYLEAASIDTPTLSSGEITKTEMSFPAKEHYTVINYHKMIESPYARYMTKTVVGKREVSWHVFEDVYSDVNANATEYGISQILHGKQPYGQWWGPLPEIGDHVGWKIDPESNNITIDYTYDVTFPVLPAATSEFLYTEYKSKFPEPTAKLIEFTYPKYVQLRAKDFASDPALNIPAELVNHYANQPIDSMALKIYDRASEFSRMNTQMNNGGTASPSMKPDVTIPLDNIAGDTSLINIEQVADELQEDCTTDSTGESNLDISLLDNANKYSYQQWLLSAMMADSFGGIVNKFDFGGKPRREYFMKSCLKIYDLAFTNGVTNILDQVVNSPLFQIEVFDRLILSAKTSLYELKDILCPPNDPGFGAAEPLSVADLLNTDSLKEAARQAVGDVQCDDNAFRRGIERIAVLAYIRVVLAENILRALLLFTVVEPKDLIKNNKIFLEYIVYALRRSAALHNDIYYEKILDICFDIVLSDIGCSIGTEPIYVFDNIIVFEKLGLNGKTSQDYINDVKDNKTYNLEWVLHHPHGQKRLPALKKICLQFIIQQQIDEMIDPVTHILTITGLEKDYKLELKNALLGVQRDEEGVKLENPWYYDAPLNLIDYSFYAGFYGFSEYPDSWLATTFNTYFPNRFYNSKPLETTVEAEKDFQKDTLEVCADINVDACDPLFDPYEEITAGFELKEDFTVGSGAEAKNYINIGFFTGQLRNQNRSYFYESPPVMSETWVDETSVTTLPGYALLSAKPPPRADDMQHYIIPILTEAIQMGTITAVKTDYLGHWETPSDEALPKNATGNKWLVPWDDPQFNPLKPLDENLNNYELSFTVWKNTHPDEWEKIKTALGIHYNGDEWYWVPVENISPSFLVLLGWPNAEKQQEGPSAYSIQGSSEEFISEVLGEQDDVLFSSKLTPLGKATKNGGFAIQRYLKIKINNDVAYAGDNYNWKLAFNFGFDGGARYGMNVNEVGENISQNFTFSPQGKEIINIETLTTEAAEVAAVVAGTYNYGDGVYDLDPSKHKKDYFQSWREQSNSYFSTKALDYSILNSFLFTAIADAYEEGQGGHDHWYSVFGSSLESFYYEPKILKHGEEIYEFTAAEAFADPQVGLFNNLQSLWHELADSPLSLWFEKISIGQRLVYVFPHDMDITKQSTDNLPPEVKAVVEAEGLFDILDEDEDLIASKDELATDVTDGSQILNTTYEKVGLIGGSYEKSGGTFAKILRKNLAAEDKAYVSGNPDVTGLLKHGTAGESLKEEMFSRRWLRQQEMVLKPNTTDIGLKRVYSLPMAGCSVEYDAQDLLGTKYGEFITYYATKQKELEAMHAEIKENIINSFMGKKDYLKENCGDLYEEENQYLQVPMEVFYGYITSGEQGGWGGPAMANWFYEAITGVSDQWVSFKQDMPEPQLKLEIDPVTGEEIGTSTDPAGDLIRGLLEPYIGTGKIEVPDDHKAPEVVEALNKCYESLRVAKTPPVVGFVDNFCQTTEIFTGETNDIGEEAKADIDSALTTQLFNKPKAKLLSKYILSDEVIRNMALLHTIFYPVEPAVGMDNLFLSTKELLFSLGESATDFADDDPFYSGDSNFNDQGGAIGASKIALDKISTSKASNAIVAYFQNLAPKMILKGLVATTDPAWMRVFSVQKLTGFNDKYLPLAMLAARPVPLIPPPIGDITAPITPFGMVYLGLSFLDALSENNNAEVPDPEAGVDACENLQES